MSTGHAAYPHLGRESERIDETEITRTKTPTPSGRIGKDEPVTVEGRTGVWLVKSFAREGAVLVSLYSVSKTVLRGVEYKRLRRVTR